MKYLSTPGLTASAVGASRSTRLAVIPQITDAVGCFNKHVDKLVKQVNPDLET